MKKAFVLVSAIVLFALLVSCDGGGGASVEVDASNLDGSWKSVSGWSRITIENMDSGKMYAVKTQGGSRSVARDATSDTVFQSGDSSYIPVPDKNNKSSFYANDINIHGSGQIQVVELRDGSDDMTIKEAEDEISYYNDRGEAVYEEYYHIDFTQPPYDTLDRSRIALLTYHLGSGSGGTNWGYVTMGEGGLKPEGYTAGLYDFSAHDSVNLYSQMCVAHSSNPWSLQLIVTNPVVCTEGVAMEIPSKYGVFSIGPLTPGKQYVMEISKKSGLDYADSFNLRYVGGDFSGFVFPLSETSSTAVYYIGEIEKELLADIWIYIGGYTGTDFGSVLFREATSDELEEYRSHIRNYDGSDMTIEYRFETFGEYIYLLKYDDELPSNIELTVEYKYDNGLYSTEGCSTYLRSAHTYGVGHSGNSLIGSYSRFIVSSSDILQQISLQSYASQPVNVTVTLHKLEEPHDGHDERCHLFIVKNNGEPIDEVILKQYSTYEIPVLTKAGSTYKGMYYGYMLREPGERITVENLYTAMVAVWE